MSIQDHIKQNTTHRKFRYRDGAELKITDMFTCFVTPRFKNINNPAESTHREWHVYKGANKKIVVRGTSVGTENEIMALAVKKAKEYIQAEKYIFDQANDILTQIEADK